MFLAAGICAVLVAAFALLALPCQAASKPESAPASGTLVDRGVLILYNSGQNHARTIRVDSEAFQTICNYFGLVATTADVAQRPLPDDDAMRGVRAVIIGPDATGPESAPPFHAWLLHQLDHGRKLVVLGELSLDAASANDPQAYARLLELYARLGVRYHGDSCSDRSLLRFASLDPAMTSYETSYPAVPFLHMTLTPLRPDVTVHVSVERTDVPNSQSAVVFTSSAGGLILAPEYAYSEDPITFNHKWLIDPFAFLAKSLDLPLFPVPDPTTLNGRRVAFSHVDADGFSGQSQLDPKKLCADVMLEQVFSQTDFPIAVSVIQAEVDPAVHGSDRLMAVARKIMALPNVEPASHTFSHPFFWDPESADKDNYDERFAFDIPGYTFDAVKEIVGSTDFVTNMLAPPGKPCRLLFWSGACDPLAAHQRIATEHGLLAINGGDTVWDPNLDSLFNVFPLHHPLGGGQQQIYIGQANDNILTNLWQGPFNGYRNVIRTMERTGSPRRLKPIDAYFHFFSGEKLAGVNAIKEVYAWIAAQPVAPVRVSRYIQSMMDWLGERVYRLGPDRYAVEGYGDCLTLRLPSDGPFPDLARCQNVLGYDREPQGVYVHLAPGAHRAVVALTRTLPAVPDKPFLQSANGLVSAMRVAPGAVRLETRFFIGNGTLTLAGFPPGVSVAVSGSAVGGTPRTQRVEKDGLVALKGLASGTLEVTRP